MRALVRLSAVALLGLFGMGCVHAYAEPRMDEPHALVRVRVVRHRWAGPQLDETVRLNGFGIALGRAGPEPSIRAMRVRPEPALWRFSTAFFHTVQVMRIETYQESYSCGSYTSSGYGGHTTTQTRTCYRPRTRQVWTTQRIDDATCASIVAHTPLAGGAYLVQFDFYGHGQCQAQCFRQVSLPYGEFRLVPCGASEPPVEVAGPVDAMTPAPWWRPAAATEPAPSGPVAPPPTSGGDEPSDALGAP